jgi:uncharacterized iron-regulated membrane protein
MPGPGAVDPYDGGLAFLTIETIVFVLALLGMLLLGAMKLVVWWRRRRRDGTRRDG